LKALRSDKYALGIFRRTSCRTVRRLLAALSNSNISCTLLEVEHPGTNLSNRISKFKSRITHLFDKKDHFDDRGFAGTSI
jgi:hypothetical protein